MKRTNELTRAELQVMNILWDMGKGTVSEILEKFPEPQPAYNTVLTFLRILKEKKFVASEPIGKQHRFYPLVQHGEYTRNYMRSVKDNLFRGSAASLVNFFVKEENLSTEEIEELIALLKDGAPSKSSQARLLCEPKGSVVATDAHSASAPKGENSDNAVL